MAIDSFASIGGADAKEHCPLFLRVQLVAYDLGLSQRTIPVHHFHLFFVFTFDVHLNHLGTSHQCQFGIAHPFPEDDVFIQF